MYDATSSSHPTSHANRVILHHLIIYYQAIPTISSFIIILLLSGHFYYFTFYHFIIHYQAYYFTIYYYNQVSRFSALVLETGRASVARSRAAQSREAVGGMKPLRRAHRYATDAS